MEAISYYGKDVSGNSNIQDPVLYLPLIKTETISKSSQVLLAMFPFSIK